MIKQLFSVLLVSLALMSTAGAQSLPGHYPDGGFNNTGRVDAIYLDKGKVVVGDIDYNLSDSLTVHSLSRPNDSVLRLRKGSHIAFKVVGGQTITEVWLLPDTYKPRGRR